MRPLALLVILLAAPAAADAVRELKPAGIDGMCAVTVSNAIVCDHVDALPSAEMRARDFVPSYHPVVVRTDGTVVRVRRTSSTEKPTIEPIAVPFKVKQAGLFGSHKSDQLCVVGDKGELACGPFDVDFIPKVQFTRIKGRFVDVRFANSALWALDDHGALWCGGSNDCARVHAAQTAAPTASLLELAASWPRDAGALTDAPVVRIADGVKRVYVGGRPCIERTADATSLVCWGETAPAVYSRPKGDELASVRGWICARTGATIACTMAGDKYAKPMSVTIKGATKMYSDSMSLCVDVADELRCAEMIAPLPPLEKVVWTTRPTH